MQVRRHPHFRVICAALVILSIPGCLRWLAPGSVSGSKMRYTKLGANGPEVSIVCLVRAAVAMPGSDGGLALPSLPPPPPAAPHLMHALGCHP